MLRMNYLTSETMVIITHDVMLNVTPRTASTVSEVSILQAGDRLDALGMRLDMMNDSFELLENVRAHYAIP
jgi:lipopolysaccharide export system protein LptC